MSRSISEPIEPEEEKPEISNAEILDVGVASFFSMEQIHEKLDAIMNHLGIENPEKPQQNPEN